MNFFDKFLFVFEMANNHMGDLEHGIRIIQEFYNVSKEFRDDFQFAFKFQYRDLETFIHPEYKGRFDFKYIKRFTETNLSKEERRVLMEKAKELGFITICTPFDERSVDLIEEHGYDIIKIASCSFTDWPLLERIALTDKPIIASTAGATLEDIDKVVTFLEHREKKFCLMHCVGEYPTSKEHLELNQIDLLRSRYPNIPIGFSTHEDPENTDAIKIAIAKGAVVFERHVGIETERYKLNSYSSTPDQIRRWLISAKEAIKMCGIKGDRYKPTEKEKMDLRGLQRGVYAKRDIREGERIDLSNTFFAIPNMEDQLVSNDMSKYTEFISKKEIKKNQPIMTKDVIKRDLRDRIVQIVNEIRPLLIESKIALPDKVDIEISHHYGIERFEEYGATIINCINREYCKKLILLLPGQTHPVHYHKKKEEAFHVLYGDVELVLDGEIKKCKAGDIIIIEKGVSHSFSSRNGAIIEEISTTHYKDDSFYEDERIMNNKQRKTYLTYWSDWLLRPIK